MIFILLCDITFLHLYILRGRLHETLSTKNTTFDGIWQFIYTKTAFKGTENLNF